MSRFLIQVPGVEPDLWGVVMVERGLQQRLVLPLALGLGGALFVAFAILFGGGNRAGALTNCTVSHDSLDTEEQAFLALINDYRAQNGLGALTISTNLNRAAAWMVEDLGTNNYFSHTDSLGRSPYARAIDCGYPSGAGENLAAGGAADSASAAMQMWKGSPGHNTNMLGGYYQQIGIARHYTSNSTYGWYWGTAFGTSNDGTGGGGAGNPPPATSTPTRTPTNTPVPQATSTPTQPAATSTPTTNQGAGGASPTQPAPTSTPTKTPTPNTSTGASATPPPPTVPGGTSTPGAAATPSATPTRTPTAGPTHTPTAPATPTQPGSSLPLSPGANLVAWPGASMAVDKAFGGNNTVAVVYEWDAARGEWKRYFPGLPSFLNNLQDLRQGNAYWVIAKTKSALTFAR